MPSTPLGELAGTIGSAEPEPGRLGQPARGVRDLAQLAGQADLAEGDDVGRQRMIDQCTDDGEAHRQVATRLGQSYAADCGRKDLVLGHRHAGAPFEHGQQQGQTAGVEPLSAASRRDAQG